MTVRDAERFKDKVEVSLDSRQIFFLFFGGAVVACLVFVLGVMVGKRLEGRERTAHKTATSATVNPLAALDELGADETAANTAKADDLAFPAALGGESEQRQKPLGSVDVPTPPVVAAAQPKPAPPPVVTPPAPPPVVKVADKPADKVADKVVPEKVADKDKVADKATKKYTLQISSFQERTEADALVAKLISAGYKPSVIMSNVADKGVFFRVRVGEFSTKPDAAGAKSDFEKKEHIIAYVTKI